MYNITKLSNGIPVSSWYMSHVKSVAIAILVKVGSRYENEGEFGICHFLEHMAFKGTSKRSARKIAEEFDDIGGQFNAYTSKECTVYYAKVLVEHVDVALDILSDILQNSKFDSQEIEKERKVIEQEIAQTEDDPGDLSYENLMSVIFENQPLGRPIIGTKDSIAEFDTASFVRYVNKNYHSSNMFICIAGNLDHSRVVTSVEKNFSSIPDGPLNKYTPSSPSSGIKIVTKDNLEQATFLLAFNGISHAVDIDLYRAKVLSVILGGGMSSRLFQKIREEMGLVYSIYAFNAAFSDSGIFGICASTTSDNVQKVVSLSLDEISLLINGITQQELDRAKQQIKSSVAMSQERNSYKAEEIAKNIAFKGRYIDADEIINKIQEISIEDLCSMGQKIFASTKSFSAVGPEFAFDPEVLNKVLV